MISQKKTRIIMVCMGNICRSPTAEGVLRHKLALRGLSNTVEVASAGTHADHLSDPPDARAQAHAARRGYDISQQRAHRLRSDDFASFYHLLAMDRDNLAWLLEKCPPEHIRKVGRLMRCARCHRSPVVPDPYYARPMASRWCSTPSRTPVMAQSRPRWRARRRIELAGAIAAVSARRCEKRRGDCQIGNAQGVALLLAR